MDRSHANRPGRAVRIIRALQFPPFRPLNVRKPIDNPYNYPTLIES